MASICRKNNNSYDSSTAFGCGFGKISGSILRKESGYLSLKSSQPHHRHRTHHAVSIPIIISLIICPSFLLKVHHMWFKEQQLQHPTQIGWPVVYRGLEHFDCYCTKGTWVNLSNLQKVPFLQSGLEELWLYDGSAVYSPACWAVTQRVLVESQELGVMAVQSWWQVDSGQYRAEATQLKCYSQYWIFVKTYYNDWLYNHLSTIW